MYYEIVRKSRKQMREHKFKLSLLSLFFFLFFLPSLQTNTFFTNLFQFLILFLFVYLISFYIERQNRRGNKYKSIIYMLKELEYIKIFKYILSNIIPTIILVLIANIYFVLIKLIFGNLLMINNIENMLESSSLSYILLSFIAYTSLFIPILFAFKYFYTIVIINYKLINKSDDIKNVLLLPVKSNKMLCNNFLTVVKVWLKHIPWTFVSVLSFGICAIYAFPYYILAINRFARESIKEEERKQYKLAKGL